MPRRSDKQPLSDQERTFCRAYVRLGSCVAAAREADYAFPEQLGYKLLKRPKIREEVTRLTEQVNASRDPALVADALEVRAKVTWLMRHGESDEVQLKAAMVLAKLIGLGTEFSPGVGNGQPGAPSLLAAKDYSQKSVAELREAGRVVAFKLLKSGDGNS